jgi:hypothetical protein
MLSYSSTVAFGKASETTTISSALDSREYWRVHGTSWRSLFELHCEIVDRLRASSSCWVSFMTTCPTCGSDPCINPNFCRLYRDADRRKTRNKLNRLAWNPQPEAETKTEKPVKEPLVGEWAADAWNSWTWKQAAADYHWARAGHVLIAEIQPEDLARLRRLMDDDVSFERAWFEQLNNPDNRPTPKATVEAVLRAVRESGLAALKEPATAERLRRCDAAAKAEIEQRIAKLQGN